LGTPQRPHPRQTHAPAWVRTAFGDADDTGHALQLCHTTSGPSSQDRCFVTGLATPRGFMSGCQVFWQVFAYLSIARAQLLNDVMRGLPLQAQLLGTGKSLGHASIMCSNTVTQRTQGSNIFVEPTSQSFTIRQTNITVHFRIARGQARHIAEAASSKHSSIPPRWTFSYS